MEFLEIVRKKRDGGKLSREEIEFLVERYVDGDIPDYQMSAFLMTVYFNSLDTEETAYLTESMAESGDQLDLSRIEGFKVDKHSSGGVGDSVSLVLVPLVGAVGLKMGKLSGRGLGHTGGTIDKLESIPGFRVSLSEAEFLENVERTGVSIMEHTSDLVPADQKLYELRDVTATVKSLPLIISSIMSKKIACGPDGVVLDVKTGSGAIVDSYEEAEELASGCVGLGQEVGLNVSALITDMSQPLGSSVGNALEVREAIKVLKGEKKGDLREVTVNLTAELLLQSPRAGTLEEGLEIAEEKLDSGKALEKFESLVESQEGDPRVASNPDLLPESEERLEISAPDSGYVSELNALEIGKGANLLGAGRSEKGQEIDPAVGVVLNKKLGDEVEENEPLAWLHYNDREHLEEVQRMVQGAFTVSDNSVEKPALIKKKLR